MEKPSQALLDLVGTKTRATDYRIAKLLGVTRSAVSRWRTGDGEMSPVTVERACQLAGIVDVFRWRILIEAEREKGPDGDFARAVRADLERLAANKPIDRNGYLGTLLQACAARSPRSRCPR
jgi:transcriptional regulator with XRE-family HTH domain